MSNYPEPIVILGTGRSFTSVICCMIGQHPDMIGLPETNIFRDPTLGEVYSRFGKGPMSMRRAGLLRTLAYFHDGTQDDAAIDAAERFVIEHGHFTASEIAAYIQKLAAPRGLVEKSISTCRDQTSLQRVLDAWPNARFLHITRQPEAILSSMQSRVDGLLERGKGRRLMRMLQNHDIDKYYIHYTEAILQFMVTLRPGQALNLCGEHFLTDARLYCRQICEWAGLDSSDAALDAMMHPENNPFAHRGPQKAVGGMSASFLENPHYSGKPVPIAPMSVDTEDPHISADKRRMALLGMRLGYT